MATNDDRWFSFRRLAVLTTVLIWIIFACGLPLRTAREARLQAHAQLAQVLADGPPNVATVIAAFDRATQDVVAACTVPCLGLAICIVILIHQMLKLKRRYNALQQDLRTCQVEAERRTDDLLD